MHQNEGGILNESPRFSSNAAAASEVIRMILVCRLRMRRNDNRMMEFPFHEVKKIAQHRVIGSRRQPMTDPVVLVILMKWKVFVQEDAIFIASCGSLIPVAQVLVIVGAVDPQHSAAPIDRVAGRDVSISWSEKDVRRPYSQESIGQMNEKVIEQSFQVDAPDSIPQDFFSC